MNSFRMGVVSGPPGLPCPGVQNPAACPRPSPLAPDLTTPQPGQELPFSQARRRDCTPPPQLLLHLLQEPQEAQKMGTGQGVFSLQNLGKRGRSHHPKEEYWHPWQDVTWEIGKEESPLGHPENPGHFVASPESVGPQSSDLPDHALAHLSSRPLPTQMRPPWRGAGLLQLRWRTWKPIPQDVLHCAQEDHGVHAPFLGEAWDRNRCPSKS